MSTPYRIVFILGKDPKYDTLEQKLKAQVNDRTIVNGLAALIHKYNVAYDTRFDVSRFFLESNYMQIQFSSNKEYDELENIILGSKIVTGYYQMMFAKMIAHIKQCYNLDIFVGRVTSSNHDMLVQQPMTDIRRSKVYENHWTIQYRFKPQIPSPPKPTSLREHLEHRLKQAHTRKMYLNDIIIKLQNSVEEQQRLPIKKRKLDANERNVRELRIWKMRKECDVAYCEMLQLELVRL